MMKNVVIVLTFLFLLISCNLDQPVVSENCSVRFEYEAAAVFSYHTGGYSKGISVKSPVSYSGILKAENLITGVTEYIDWFAVIDEDAHSIKSSKTTILASGTYNFYLTLSRGTHQYYGEALDRSVNNNNADISITLKPVIGDLLGETNVSRIAALKFNYPADDFAGFISPKLGYSIDGGNETIIELSAGTHEVYFYLAEGVHTIELQLYSGNKIIGRSLAAQEKVAVIYNENISMDIHPLHVEGVFAFNLSSSEAGFSVTIPEDIINEAGNATNVSVFLNTTGGVNTSREAELVLQTNDDGTHIGSYTLTNFNYDTTNISLVFKEKSSGDIIGSAVKGAVELGRDNQVVIFDLEVMNRAVITGNLLSVLGISVFDMDNKAVPNATIYINDTFSGIAGSETYGVPGYIKKFILKGEYTVRAEHKGYQSADSVALAAFDITTLDLVLNIPIEPETDIVTFPDWILENAIRSAINKPAGDILKSDLLVITTLSVISHGITDIRGIEYCTNLVDLDLSGNQISSINSISSLTKLEKLNLSNNKISMIAGLNSLPGLTELNLVNNQIVYLNALSGHRNLNKLYLGGNQISDVTPLSGLTNLEVLHLNNNIIEDFSSFDGMIKMTQLNLSSNQIADIQALSVMSKLTYLELSSNRIHTISSISGLTALNYLYLVNNEIQDISPLTGLSNLSRLWITSNNMLIKNDGGQGTINLGVIQHINDSGLPTGRNFRWQSGNITE